MSHISIVADSQGKAPNKLALKRYYRPEDISVQHAYEAALNEIFSSDETLDVEVDNLERQCSVVHGEMATGTCFCCLLLTSNQIERCHTCSKHILFADSRFFLLLSKLTWTLSRQDAYVHIC